MSFEANTVFSSVVTTTTYTSATFDTGDGGPLDGMNMHILVTEVLGNPNVLFRVDVSPDTVNWFPSAYDPWGPINTIAERNIHFSLGFNGIGDGNRYYRLVGLPNELPNGGGSGNSSSLSSQSFYSSSSGGSQALYFTAGLTISANG